MNMLLTPGGLMRSLCRGWVVTHPEDAGLKPIAILRKLMRSHAMDTGCSMILCVGPKGEVQHYGLIEFPYFNG